MVTCDLTSCCFFICMNKTSRPTSTYIQLCNSNWMTSSLKYFLSNDESALKCGIFTVFLCFPESEKENLVGNSRGKPLNDLLVSWKWQHHVPVTVNSAVLCLVVNLQKHPLQMAWLYKQEDTQSLVCIQIYTVYTVQIILKYISVCFSSCLGCVWICTGASNTNRGDFDSRSLSLNHSRA